MNVEGTARRSAAVRRTGTAPERRDEPATVTLQAVCLLLTLLAAVIFTLTEHDQDMHTHTVWCAAEIVAQVSLTLLAAVYFRRRAQWLRDTSAFTPLLVMVVLLSLLCEPVQRLLFQTGHSFEMLVMHSQSNLMLALAACGFRLSCQRLAALIAVFLVIFCCAISRSPAVIPLVGVFAVLSVVWLGLGWWSDVQRRLLPGEQQTRLRPVRLLLLSPLLLLLLLFASGSDPAVSALRGFLPGSGGAGDADPFARDGVGDGDHLVAGKDNITSFAPLDDSPFMDSDKPSLYDVFNDTYDPPPRVVRQQERAIALPPDLLQHVHRQMSDAHNAGREFSLRRGEPLPNKRQTDDLRTKALLHVAGRTPVHLRMEVYDLFDGTTWYPVPPPQTRHKLLLKHEHGHHWLQVPVTGRGFEIHGPDESHALRLLNLSGNTLPVPLQTSALSIGNVNRADMYRVDAARRVSLDRDTIPEMTVVNVRSSAVDPARLPHARLPLNSRTSDSSAVLPDGFDAVRELAQSLTADREPGWDRVTAIVDHLRTHYVLDRSAKPDATADSPVHEFLFRTRRGPEYLFAASAAALLRSVGCSTRLVSGFYARPDNYDPRLRHTAVYARDAHFWCEVFVGADTWISIEPTPGYELRRPPAGLTERLLSAAAACLDVLRSHPFWSAGVALLALIAVRRRQLLLDRVLSWHWRVRKTRHPADRTLALARLVARRIRVAQLPRSEGTTFRRLAAAFAPSPLTEPLRQLAVLTDEAAFGGQPANSGLPRTDTPDTLRALERTLSLAALTALAVAVRSTSDTRPARSPVDVSLAVRPPRQRAAWQPVSSH